MWIDLNCDVGETATAADDGDAAVMAFATSVSVACGFHAGDPRTMRQTVAAAAAAGVAIGAHPGYPDREGFGRLPCALPPEAVADLVTYQVGALDGFARAAGLRLQHVKLHGALYNTAARDPAIADAAVGAVAGLGPRLFIVGPPASALADAARRHGLPFAAEVFADRTYAADGQLTARDRPDAFVDDADQAAQRIVRLLHEGIVETTAGTTLAMRGDTVCLHGDSPQALTFARRLAEALDAVGIARRAFGAGAGHR